MADVFPSSRDMRSARARALVTAVVVLSALGPTRSAAPGPSGFETNGPTWTAEGSQESERFGSALAAGDFNGDGKADALVSAPLYDTGEMQDGLNSEGRVSLYFGSGGGLSGPVWTIIGERPFIYFGTSVASAGDVNGDGTDDILIGAPLFGRDPVQFPDHAGTGLAYLYLGFSNTPSWKGGPVGTSKFGQAVASAGDVNGDGHADILVGDPEYTHGQAYEGGAFLFYGNSGGATDDPVWTAEADVQNTGFGASVASAGDVNGDGYDDVIIGAPKFPIAGGAQGRVFAYYGSPFGLHQNPDWSVTYQGPVMFFGQSVASAGDVNGDGYDDVIVGSNTFSQTGQAFVYLGSPNGLQTTFAWTVGGLSGESLGASVAGAGDVNDDGYDDVVIGVPGGAGGNGKVSVYLGSPNGLLTQPVWSGTGDSPPGNLGSAVAAGDFNGDGRNDVIAGAPVYSRGLAEIGRAEMFLATAESQIDLLDPNCTTATTCGGRYLVEDAGVVHLDPDPEKLMQADVARIGAVTDGVSRLLVRQRSDTPVTFKLLAPDGAPAGLQYGRLTRRDGSAGGNTVTVTPDQVSSGKVVFAVYEAPADFPGTPGQVGTGVVLKVTTETASNTEGAKLKLVPPPVVLVHGLWSSSEAWQGPAGGLRQDLINRGYLLCPECLVDYGWAPAGSFDPRESTPVGQAPVNQVIVATQYARDWARGRGFATTQVDVVGHSMGGLMARSRVASAWRPYVTKYTYNAGDFHKIITVGTPHLGTPLADYLVAHKCSPFPVPGGFVPLGDMFGIIGKPLDPAVYQLQTNSLALEHLNDAPFSVPTHPVVGIEPPTGTSCTETCTQDALDFILLTTGTLQTIDDLLGGQQHHDTIVPDYSQAAGLLSPISRVQDVVHANLWHDTSETESSATWTEVERLLLAPRQTEFAYLSPFIRQGDPIQPHSCLPFGHSRTASGATVTLLPSPGTIVRPGDTVTITLEVTGGGPVSGAAFFVGSSIVLQNGGGPFALDYQVPASAAGTINFYVRTFGPGPENYGDFSSLVVRPDSAPLSLSVAPDHLSFDALGEALPLRVTGQFASGPIDLSAPDAGTTYTVASGTAAVVSIESGRLVVAHGAGQDAIVVANAGVTISVPVAVSLTNHAPALASIGEIVLRADDVLTVPVGATDQDGDALRLSASTLPPFADFFDDGGGSGRLTLAPHRADVGSYTIQIAVADNGVPALGAGATITFTVQPCAAPIPTGVPIMSVDPTTLSWTSITGATAYDLVAGDVGSLRTGGYAAATLACVRNDLTDTFLYLPVTPPLGRAYWFLVRAANCRGNGTYDGGDAAQAGSSDPGIAASGRDCP
jgi:pimeloyl-ACP methyl ester carboxylesterase